MDKREFLEKLALALAGQVPRVSDRGKHFLL